MRFWFIVIILMMVLPITLASVEITSNLSNQYNLGDDISLSIKIIPEMSANALVKSTLSCGDKGLLYYISPVILEKDKEIILEIAPIKAFSEGSCKIKAEAETMEGESIGMDYSNEFLVSGKLELSFTIDKTEALPGDTIKIEGTATKQQETINGGNVFVTLDDSKAQAELSGKSFSYSIKLEDNVKSGEHKISVLANDAYGNANEQKSTIYVKAVPTSIEYELNSKEFNPNEQLALTAKIIDQAGDIMEGSIDLKMHMKKKLFRKEEIIFDDRTESGKIFSFVFAANIPPGEYTLVGSSGKLKKEEAITILPYSKIETRLEGSMLFVKNAGNVEYNNQTKIILESEGKTYIIEKRIRLGVGEEKAIDLSEELPSGVYSLTSPLAEPSVKIEDQRSLYKKGMELITGSVTAGVSLVMKRPKLAGVIMALLIVLIIAFFSRGKIKENLRKIKRKKEIQKFY